MTRIYEITGNQIRERAALIVNNTNFTQQSELYFVQLDDDHAVDNTGSIFQIVDADSASEVAQNPNAVQYQGKSGVVYNYAEDTAKFDEDSADLSIYEHCWQQAELLFDEAE